MFMGWGPLLSTVFGFSRMDPPGGACMGGTTHGVVTRMSRASQNRGDGQSD